MPQPPDPPSDPPRLPNAFSPEFLAALRETDDSPEAAESDLAGPWRLEWDGSVYRLFRTWESSAQGDAPHGVFEHLDTALLFIAALPAVGRPPIYTLTGRRGNEGFELARDGKVEAFLRLDSAEAVAAVSLLGAVARSAVASAALLAAGGPSHLEKVGQLLGRNGLAPGAGAGWW